MIKFSFFQKQEKPLAGTPVRGEKTFRGTTLLPRGVPALKGPIGPGAGNGAGPSRPRVAPQAEGSGASIARGPPPASTSRRLSWGRTSARFLPHRRFASYIVREFAAFVKEGRGISRRKGETRGGASRKLCGPHWMIDRFHKNRVDISWETVIYYIKFTNADRRGSHPSLRKEHDHGY